MFTYVGRCDTLSAGDLQGFDETAREVTPATARRLLGPATWMCLEQQLGYLDEAGRPVCPGLRLASDWAVRFETGKWRNRSAVNVRWSAYHHIFSRGHE